MKRLKLPAIILLTLLQSAFVFAQQTKVPFTVTVYNVTNTSGALGTKITSNTQMIQNKVYYVEVKSSTTGTIASMRATNVDGFTTGSYSGGVWGDYANPTQFQQDLGAVKKMGFFFKTFATPNFTNQLYMKVSQCNSSVGTCTNPGGTGWVNLTTFLFPYN